MLGPSVANFARPDGVSKPAAFEAAIKPAVIIVAMVNKNIINVRKKLDKLDNNIRERKLGNVICYFSSCACKRVLGVLQATAENTENDFNIKFNTFIYQYLSLIHISEPTRPY